MAAMNLVIRASQSLSVRPDRVNQIQLVVAIFHESERVSFHIASRES